MPSQLDIVRENFRARKDIQAELRAIDEAATAQRREYTTAEKATIEQKRSELAAIDDRITANIEIAGRSEEIGGTLERFIGTISDRETGRSVGQRFTSEGYTDWVRAGAHGKYGVSLDGLDLRAVTDTTLGATSGGAFTRPDRLTRVGQDFLDRRIFVIDELPHIPVGQGSVEYVRDVSPLADLADKAIEVAEGSAKPQAGITTEVVTEPTQVIAAWVNLTRQTAADVPQVESYLNGRLRYSVKRRADKQIISGDGTSPNISGLLDRSGINTYTAPAGSEDAYVSIRKAITLMEQDEAVPEIVVLNPSDAEQLDLSNHDADGLHAVLNIVGPSARSAWGLRQVRSTAVAPLTAVLIDPMAVAVLDRQQPTAYMTDSHGTNFTSNILTLLLEARLGLAVFDPAGICSVTFDYTP